MKEVFGNTKNIKKEIILKLEDLYSFQVVSQQLLSSELVASMVEITDLLNKEVAVYLNRSGVVEAVILGDHETVSLPQLTTRNNEHKLNGIRCIHTHPNGNGMLSEIDITALKQTKMDAMVAIGVLAQDVSNICIGFLTPVDKSLNIPEIELIGPLSLGKAEDFNVLKKVAEIEKDIVVSAYTVVENQQERAILVGFLEDNSEDPLAELTELTKTAGAQIVGKITQRRQKPDAAFYIGRGKAQELALLRQKNEAQTIIFDNDLSPSQQNNLALLTGAKIIDRTGLILDIFAQRARTREGKLQVALAQLNYLLPRLTGQGTALSRLGGGIGTRGPGETKLETDRRHIQRRIQAIKNELEEVKNHRKLHRQNRQSEMIPVFALVGYTNAGKSTLLNTLTNSDVFAENKLFATLDPTTRRLELPDNKAVLLTDTVGFIKKLPHHLVAAFRATLEEVQESQCLLHVVDISAKNWEEQITAVNEVLERLKSLDKPTILVLNKIDLVPDYQLPPMLNQYETIVPISAVTGQGLDILIKKITARIDKTNIEITLIIPYDKSGLVNQLYSIGKVLEQEYQEDGLQVKVQIPRERYEQWQSFERK